MMFARSQVFTPSMAHFVNQSHGTNWFRREFITLTIKHQVKVVDIWRDFLTPKLLSTRLATGNANLGIVGYQPNMVTRQFVFNQCLSNSLFSLKRDLFLSTVEMNEEKYLVCLA